MEYGHRWLRRKTIDEKVFNKIVDDMHKVALAAKIPLADVHGKAQYMSKLFKTPSKKVAFQGVSGKSTGLFMLPQFTGAHAANPSGYFPYSCTTNKTDFDLIVQAALVICKHHLGRGFLVRSDGKKKDWAKARELCQKTLKYGGDFAIGRDVPPRKKKAAAKPPLPAKKVSTPQHASA